MTHQFHSSVHNKKKEKKKNIYIYVPPHKKLHTKCHCTVSKPKECTRVNPRETTGLWVIMMCYYVILGKKITILVSDIDNGEEHACMGDREYMGNICTFNSILL